MRILAVAGLMALSLSGCATYEQNGALIGGATGATVGAVATRSVGGAVVGGAVGAVAGAAIADATRPRWHHRHCWYSPEAGHRVCRY